ncbi:MAG: zinc-binding alcohol dehydrogenase [Chloroflexi bacterium]|nr:zinc-binding alcohol dehydrogenase [Chloroflexota bacterium]
MQGKRIMVTAYRQVQLLDFETSPDDLGPAEVVIRTHTTLLSGGTEGAWFQGLPLPGRSPTPYPRSTGYANVGEVVAAGPNATVRPGDRVYTMSNHTSLACVDTARQLCLKVPEGLPAEEAVFARLVTVPLATLRTSTARIGDRAAVVGLGLVGNLGAQLLVNAGMETTGVDLVPARRELAQRCGVAHTIDPREEGAVQPVHRLVLEASGTAKGAVTAIALAQLGGEVSLVGTPWVADPAVPSKDIIEPIHVRYLTVRSGWEWQFPIPDVRDQPGAVHQPGSVVHNHQCAFELLRQGKVRVRELITHRFSPEDCQRAYDGAVDRKSEQLGVIFQWEEEQEIGFNE